MVRERIDHYLPLLFTLNYTAIFGGSVVKWLVRWTSDLKVGGSRSSPCHRVVSRV